MPTMRIAEFDTWRPGYGGATVYVRLADSEELAEVYLDEDQTIPAANPQVLLDSRQGDVAYGKFTQGVYVDRPYYLQINSVDQTAIVRPGITSLDEEDASKGTVLVPGGDVAHSLAEYMARRIDVRDYGMFLPTDNADASSADNTAAMLAAAGVAAGNGGGVVHVPGGTFQFNPFVIPAGVVLEGEAEDATILQCTNTGNIVTIAGRAGGLRQLTLDGVARVAGSVGVYEVGGVRTVLDHVTLKRFERGRRARGIEAADQPFLTVSACVVGQDIRADKDENASNAGGPVSHVISMGGRVEFCTEAGIRFEQVDDEFSVVKLDGIAFDLNTGTALHLIGVRNVEVDDASFTGNTRHLVIEDGTPRDDDNTTGRVTVRNSVMVGGAMRLAGTLRNVSFERVDLRGVAITLDSPRGNVLAIDCTEDRNVTLLGTATSWIRQNRNARGASSGLTTGNAATKAWAVTLEPGQRAYLEAKVIARGRTTSDTAMYHIAVGAIRPVANLNFESQTQNFTTGNIITGQTSGATARIIEQTDNGTTGVLRLQDIRGVFVDNEVIVDTAAGSATVNGSLVFSDAVLSGAVAAIRPAVESDAAFDATFVANGPEIELRVTGNTGKNVEWICDVEVLIA